MEPAFKEEHTWSDVWFLTGLAVFAGMKLYRWRRWGGGWHGHGWRHRPAFGFGHHGFRPGGDGYGPDFRARRQAAGA